ncbi:hypothetical protein [Syntrophomonas wolfei]|nr:hypothetical protein [Syntrophomonas wolfei]
MIEEPHKRNIKVVLGEFAPSYEMDDCNQRKIEALQSNWRSLIKGIAIY